MTNDKNPNYDWVAEATMISCGIPPSATSMASIYPSFAQKNNHNEHAASPLPCIGGKIQYNSFLHLPPALVHALRSIAPLRTSSSASQQQQQQSVSSSSNNAILMRRRREQRKSVPEELLGGI